MELTKLQRMNVYRFEYSLLSRLKDECEKPISVRPAMKKRIDGIVATEILIIFGLITLRNRLIR